MKKIKLFALAAFAMLSTNVFAQSDGTSATKVFTFDHFSDGTAIITGFVADLDDEFKAATAIPETVTHPTEKVGGKAVKYFVTQIADNAFKGEPIETITFPAAVAEDEYKGIENIGEGAFAQTKITKLDLTNTIITYVRNFFGTVRYDGDKKKDVVNATLTSVILPATAIQIKSKAFWGCTKLATVDMSAATGLTNINQAAFAGCSLKALDLSKNKKITELKANVLNDKYDGEPRYNAPTALVKVTLHQDFTALNNNLQGAVKLTSVTGHIYTNPAKKEFTAFTAVLDEEFKDCAALTDFDTHKITTFGESCFEGCSSLATVNISLATSIPAKAFKGTALESVTFPAGITSIGANAYFECASLGTVAFNTNPATQKTSLTSIGEGAFGYTAIKAFTLPAKNTEGFTIAAKAFVGCSSLKSFTYAPDEMTKDNAKKISVNAFNRCSGVAFHTTKEFADKWRDTYVEGNDNYNGPTNTKFDYSVDDGKTKFTLTPYKSNSKKYYVKWNGKKADGTAIPIKIKKGDAKVYGAYVDADDHSLNLVQYAAESGWIYIKQGDVALIITENAELTYEGGETDKTTSWQSTVASDETTLVTGTTKNALKYVDTKTTRATLESAVDEGWYIYGWVNTTSATGFQKITSGNTINAGVMFAWANPDAAGRLTIKWLDENGNLESEATAINGVKAAAETEGQRYNVAGQKVSASYKGVVIKDGKKYMQK